MATKGGGSLLGRADSTLAQMSYREAMADVGPDLKSVYSEKVLKIILILFTLITTL